MDGRMQDGASLPHVSDSLLGSLSQRCHPCPPPPTPGSAAAFPAEETDAFPVLIASSVATSVPVPASPHMQREKPPAEPGDRRNWSSADTGGMGASVVFCVPLSASLRSVPGVGGGGKRVRVGRAGGGQDFCCGYSSHGRLENLSLRQIFFFFIARNARKCSRAGMSLPG